MGAPIGDLRSAREPEATMGMVLFIAVIVVLLAMDRLVGHWHLET